MARASAGDFAEVETYPEADRLQEFSHPRETEVLFGHDEAVETLCAALRSGQMPHAWLLTGAEGIGKATMAYKFAKYVLANSTRSDDFDSASFNLSEGHVVEGQVRALSHPNLLLLRKGWNIKDKRFYSSILVDDVRKLLSFFGLTAGEGSWRIVIVDQADDLNENAANALLKSLEEPPERCIFLLITAAAAGVLTTIRSRCRRLDLNPLGFEDFSRAISQACHSAGVPSPGGDELNRLALLANGSVRRALTLHTGNGVTLYDLLIGIFKDLPELNLRKADELAEKIGVPSAEADYDMFFSLLSDMLHRILRHRAAGTDCIREEAEIAHKLLTSRTLAKWAELWETVGQAQRQARALNLDRKTLILETLQKLKEAASS